MDDVPREGVLLTKTSISDFGELTKPSFGQVQEIG